MGFWYELLGVGLKSPNWSLRLRRGRTPIYANCRSLNRAASESCKQCDSRLPPLGPAAGINGRIVGHLGALRSQHIPAPSIKGFRSTGYHNLACRMATKLARARQGPESQVQNLQACGSCKLESALRHLAEDQESLLPARCLFATATVLALRLLASRTGGYRDGILA